MNPAVSLSLPGAHTHVPAPLMDSDVYTHAEINSRGGRLPFCAMEMFWSKAQIAISHMIAEMLPLTSFSVRSSDQFLDIWLEI